MTTPRDFLHDVFFKYSLEQLRSMTISIMDHYDKNSHQYMIPHKFTQFAREYCTDDEVPDYVSRTYNLFVILQAVITIDSYREAVLQSNPTANSVFIEWLTNYLYKMATLALQEEPDIGMLVIRAVTRYVYKIGVVPLPPPLVLTSPSPSTQLDSSLSSSLTLTPRSSSISNVPL